MTIYPQRRWDFHALIVVHLFIFILVLSWVFPPSRHLWDTIDRHGFYFLNHMIAENSFWQNFWGIANHKRVDWLHDFFMFLFFYYYILKSSPKKKITRISELILSIFFFFIVIMLINKTAFPNFIHFSRNSPSLVFDEAVRLNREVSWLYIKDYSRCSFPADHGTTASLFVGTIFFLMGRKVGFVALAYGIFFCLPRLVVGAHFITDVLIGSLPIALFSLAWAYFSPFFFYSARLIENVFSLKKEAT